MAIKLNRKGVGLSGAELDKENENLTLIEQELQRVESAVPIANEATMKATEALAKATTADSRTDNTQKQLNTLVVQGDSSPQAVQASVGFDGKDYGGSLKARLDAEQQKVASQISDIAVNVKKFGAKGDGITDDYVAIQSAIDHCFNNRINEVFFPKGDYIISKPLLVKTREQSGVSGWWDGDGITLRGQNKVSSKIIKKGEATLTGVHAEVDGVDAAIITFAAVKIGSTGGPATGTGIKQMTIRNSSTSPNSYAMTGKACQRMILDDSNFHGYKGLFFPGMFSSMLSNLLIGAREDALKAIQLDTNLTSNTFKNIYCSGVKNPYTIHGDYTSIDLLYADDCTGTIFNLYGLGLKANVLGTESPKAKYIVSSNILANTGGVIIDNLYLFRQIGDSDTGLSPADCAIFTGSAKIQVRSVSVLEQNPITTNSYIYNSEGTYRETLLELGQITYYKNFTGTANPKLLMTKNLPDGAGVEGKFIGDGSMVNLRRSTHMPYLGTRSTTKSAQFPFKDKAIYLDNETHVTSSTENLEWMAKYNTGDVLLINDPKARHVLGYVVTGIGGDNAFVRDNTFAKIPIYEVGTTAQRPTLNLFAGLQYYDTTLSKPVWWNGSAWKDAMGTNV